jgi:hypothetical protein
MLESNLPDRVISCTGVKFTGPKPDLPGHLFWDTRYDEIDWQAASRTIIERVIDRGNDEQWEELIRFYGLDKVMQVLKCEPIYLMDDSIDRACAYFNVKREELRCYTRKQSRGGHWI